MASQSVFPVLAPACWRGSGKQGSYHCSNPTLASIWDKEIICYTHPSTSRPFVSLKPRKSCVKWCPYFLQRQSFHNLDRLCRDIWLLRLLCQVEMSHVLFNSIDLDLWHVLWNVFLGVNDRGRSKGKACPGKHYWQQWSSPCKFSYLGSLEKRMRLKRACNVCMQQKRNLCDY